VTDNACWIRQVHQNKTSDHKVHGLRQCELGDVACAELHVGNAGCSGARRGHRNRLRRAIHADDIPTRAHQAQREERNVTSAAADVQHAHAGDHACITKQSLREIGADRLRQVYGAPSDEFAARVNAVYGRPLQSLEADWLRFCDAWVG